MSLPTGLPAGDGLLAGRTVLVTGALRPRSIATAVARESAGQGARVLLTSQSRTLRLTEAVASGLGLEDAVLPLDVTDPGDLAALAGRLRSVGVTQLDGVVHAVAHADPGLLGDRLTPHAGPGGPSQETVRLWQEAVAAALAVSATSLPALTGAVRDLLAPGAGVVALTFVSQRATPGYGWMAPAKAALEACVRGLAVELGPAGVRVNALAAGPLRTPAGGAVPGLAELAARWDEAAPLGWDDADAAPVARTAVALLSDWLPATTGQVVRADGGASAVTG